MRTARGEPLTDEMIERLAAEAEAGYDPAKLRARPRCQAELLRTASGKLLTEEEIDRMAARMEAGIDLAKLRARPRCRAELPIQDVLFICEKPEHGKLDWHVCHGPERQWVMTWAEEGV